MSVWNIQTTLFLCERIDKRTGFDCESWICRFGLYLLPITTYFRFADDRRTYIVYAFLLYYVRIQSNKTLYAFVAVCAIIQNKYHIFNGLIHSTP